MQIDDDGLMTVMADDTEFAGDAPTPTSKE